MLDKAQPRDLRDIVRVGFVQPMCPRDTADETTESLDEIAPSALIAFGGPLDERPEHNSCARTRNGFASGGCRLLHSPSSVVDAVRQHDQTTPCRHPRVRKSHPGDAGEVLVTHASTTIPRMPLPGWARVWTSPDFGGVPSTCGESAVKGWTPMPKTRPAYPEQFRRAALELVRRGRSIRMSRGRWGCRRSRCATAWVRTTVTAASATTDGDEPFADLVCRDVRLDAPDRAWCADIKQTATGDGWMYPGRRAGSRQPPESSAGAWPRTCAQSSSSTRCRWRSRRASRRRGRSTTPPTAGSTSAGPWARPPTTPATPTASRARAYARARAKTVHNLRLRTATTTARSSRCPPLSPEI